MYTKIVWSSLLAYQYHCVQQSDSIQNCVHQIAYKLVCNSLMVCEIVQWPNSTQTQIENHQQIPTTIIT